MRVASRKFMDTKGMIGAEAFLQLLADMGVDHIFASPGSCGSSTGSYPAHPLRDSLAALQRGLERRSELTRIASAAQLVSGQH